MRICLIVVVFIGTLAASCGESKQEPNRSAETPSNVKRGGDVKSDPGKAAPAEGDVLPLCSIEKIESCDVEAVESSGTIYSCPSCGHVLPCPSCKKDPCDHCGKGKKECLCRVQKE